MEVQLSRKKENSKLNINEQSAFVDTKRYYELTDTKSITNKELYEKFLNWVSGEFESYLQVKLNGLQIFFPGGWIYIHEIDTNNDGFRFKIIVRSKFKQKGIQINNQVYAILDHVIKLKKPSIS